MILNRCRRTTPPGTREIISKKDKDKQMKPNAQAFTAFARQKAWDLEEILDQLIGSDSKKRWNMNRFFGKVA